MKFSTVLRYACIIILFVYVMCSIAPGLFATHSPYQMISPFESPSRDFLFGTDNLGRDLFSRVIYGSRISIMTGVIAVAISTLIGSFIGLIAGFIKVLENPLMRLMDAIWTYPSILLGLGIGAAIGGGLFTVILTIGIVYTPIYARLIYGQTLSVKEYDYVTAVVAMGGSQIRILLKHILPNIVAPVIVQFSLNVGTAIVFEAGLSFLGVGIQPPEPSWGIMLRSGYRFMETAPWLAFVPGMAIYIIVATLNILGDQLRVILDPKQKGRYFR